MKTSPHLSVLIAWLSLIGLSVAVPVQSEAQDGRAALLARAASAELTGHDGAATGSIGHRPSGGAWRPVTGPGAGESAPAFNRELEQMRFPSLEEMERRHIEAALHLFGGNRTRTCAALCK